MNRNVPLVAGGIALAALVGALSARFTAPQPGASAPRTTRPIVQIVRQQPGLPDVSAVIDRLCPSIASIVPRGDAAPVGAPAVPAIAVSADGWLLTTQVVLSQAPLEIVFSDGRKTTVTEGRGDPVSGLAIVKADGVTTVPLPMSDQLFPPVGQFALGVGAPAGNGCSAGATMVASDFLADGGGPFAYVRVQFAGDAWTTGSPFVGGDGRLIGIGAAKPDGALIPAPLAAVIVDELIRNELAPSTAFGIRAADFTASIAARLGNVRSGAGIAFVQDKSRAARSGLQAGDIAIAVNDQPVSSASELNRALDALPKSGTLTVMRGSQQLQFTVARS